MSVRSILLVLALPLLMGSEVYRYVDSNGVVTYAQQLPYGVQGERITTVAGAPTQGSACRPDRAREAGGTGFVAAATSDARQTEAGRRSAQSRNRNDP